MSKSRDVIVLGWWARVQNRIDYVALLRRELRVGLAEAKAKLENSLETGEPLVLSIAPAERALSLASLVQAMGAECRLAPGASALSASDRDAMMAELRAFHSATFDDSDSRARVAAVLCADLAVPVAAFVERARAFMSFAETAHKIPSPERARAAQKSLSALYAAGLELPDVDAGHAEADSPPRPTTWPGFGADDHYWEVFDPYKDQERLVASLSDDILDVYADIGRGLQLYDRGDRQSRLDAIWTWRLHLYGHWGDHAVDAVRALQRLISRQEEDRDFGEE